jgi:hypothetical protein
MANEILQMLEDCELHESKLTEGQSNFIQALIEKVSESPLNDREIARLTRIWNKII